MACSPAPSAPTPSRAPVNCSRRPCSPLMQSKRPIPLPTNNRLRTIARTSLFDHLVGASEQRWRHLDPERLGSLEVDDEPEAGRKLDRHLARLRALENAI